ncbi:MAG: helix-turn-helix domain-containing protein, partial [Betaproteobacteria bacterium]
VARARREPDIERGAVASGEALLERMRERHADVVATRPAFVLMSKAWLLLAEAEATRLHRRPDPQAWVAGVSAWDQLDRPYPAAYARWRESEARLAARGDRGAAAAALAASLETAKRLRAEPTAREIMGLAVRARLNLASGAAPSAPATVDAALDLGLTGREREVLALLALGRTNRQIAEELFISGNTAGVHVSNILGKLGVAGRGEAAALAYRLGLVVPSGEAEPLV